MIDVTTIEFLQALYGDPVGPGRLLVRTRSRRSGKRRSHWLHTLGQAAVEAHRQRSSREAFFSVPLHDERVAIRVTRERWPKIQGPSARPCEASAVALPALWAEIEIGDAAPPPEPGTVYRLLEAVEVPASIAVAAGGAYQAYWRLAELWRLETAGDRARARELLRRLQGALHAAATAFGWSVRHDGDLGQLLPLPDTLHFGRPAETVVRVAHFPRIKTAGAGAAGDHRYRLDDFRGLPAPPEERALDLLLGGEAAPGVSATLDLEPILAGCRWLDHSIRNARRLCGQAWAAVLAVAGRSTLRGLGGHALAHRVSEAHPGRNLEKTEEQLALALSRKPPTCRWIGESLGAGERYCRRCAHFGRLSGPVDLGRPGPAQPDPVGGDPVGGDPVGGDPVGGDPVGGDPVGGDPVGGDPAAQRRARDGGAGEDALPDLVLGLEELLADLRGQATLRQIRRRLAVSPEAYPRLRAALGRLFPGLGARDLPGTVELAGHLQAYRGWRIGGAWIDRLPQGPGCMRWTVRRAARPAEEARRVG